jgi:hypothetical protein
VQHLIVYRSSIARPDAPKIFTPTAGRLFGFWLGNRVLVWEFRLRLEVYGGERGGRGDSNHHK